MISQVVFFFVLGGDDNDDGDDDRDDDDKIGSIKRQLIILFYGLLWFTGWAA